MREQVTWTKPQREKAKQLGCALFAVGLDDCHLPKPVGRHGRWISTFCIANDLAVSIWGFANDLYSGKDVHVAFRERFGEPKRLEQPPNKGKAKRLFVECPGSDGQNWYCGGPDFEHAFQGLCHSIKEDVRRFYEGEIKEIDLNLSIERMTDKQIKALE